MRHTPDHRRVSYASFCLLDDAQLWYHRLELNGGQPTWSRFVQLENTRFGPLMTETPLSELKLLQREGTIDEYCSRFMALSCRNLSLTEDQQIQLFVVGLGALMRTDVGLMRPRTLDDAVMFARAYELCEASSTPPAAPRSSSHSSTKQAPLSLPAPSSTSAASSKPPMTKKLSPAEIADRRLNGICFHCDDKYSPEHCSACKQLFGVEVLCEIMSMPKGTPSLTRQSLRMQ